MKRFVLAAGVAAFALASAHTALADSPLRAITTVTRVATSTTTFSCGLGSSQACHYLILTSLCSDKRLADGGKEKTCNYVQALPSFQLKPGQSKTVANLPADYLYTMKAGTTPTPEECIAAPISH